MKKNIIESAIIEAVENNDVNAINQLCSKDPEIVDFLFVDSHYSGYTPLILAIILCHQEAIIALIENKADINCYYKKGCYETPLIAACANTEEGLDIVRLLLEKGAKANLYLPNRYGPILIAAHNSDFSLVQLLIENGANPNEVDDNKRSSLHHAAEKGHLEMVEFLLQHGANIDLQDEDGFTPLMMADCYDHDEVIDCLLKYKANLAIVDQYDKTVIDYAIQNEKIKRAEKYKDYINLPDHLGNSWLHKIVLSPAQTLTQLYYGGYGSSSIDEIYKKREEFVISLIKHGVDPNARNNQKETALHIAAKDESNTFRGVIFHLLFPTEVIKHFDLKVDDFDFSNYNMAYFFSIRQQFRNGTFATISDITVQDREGKTPWQNAIESRNTPYLLMFLAAGADLSRENYKLAVSYGEALLKLYDIAGDHIDLEEARPAFLQEFTNVLFHKYTRLKDETNDNYAFILYSIEAELFTSAQFAQFIRDTKADYRELPKLVKTSKKADQKTIYRFLKAVCAELAKPSAPIVPIFNQKKQEFIQSKEKEKEKSSNKTDFSKKVYL